MATAAAGVPCDDQDSLEAEVRRDYELRSRAERAGMDQLDQASVEATMNRIKRKHRSWLKDPVLDWRRNNLIQDFAQLRLREMERCAAIDRAHAAYQKQREATGQPVVSSENQAMAPYETPSVRGGGETTRVNWGIDRVHWKDLSLERFIRDYELPNRPVMITGMTEDWSAHKHWQIAELYHGKYAGLKMRCGEDDDGESLRVTIQTYLQYAQNQRDDSPLYLFDDSFDERTLGREILKDYKVPHFFSDDLFQHLPERRRPPYRWFLIGPERSGTSMHIDPLCTSAWNALIVGHKRWVLMKPSLAKEQAKRHDLKRPGEDTLSSSWFKNILPRIVAEEEEKLRQHEAAVAAGENQSADPDLVGLVEFIQYPGEIVFVPGGWWHAVLNLDDTVACTQNYVGVTQFDRVWRAVRSERRHLARRWLGELEVQAAPIYRRAMELNRLDGWSWKFTPWKEVPKKWRKRRTRLGRTVDESGWDKPQP